MISAGVDGHLTYMTYSDPWNRNPATQPPPPPPPSSAAVYFRPPRPKILPPAPPARCIEEPSHLFLPYRSYNGLNTTTCPNGTRIAQPRPVIKFPHSPPSALPVNLTSQVKDEKEPISPYYHYKSYHPPVTPYPTTFPYPSILSPSQSFLIPTPQFQQKSLSPQDTFAVSLSVTQQTATQTATFISSKSTYSPPSATIVKPNQIIKDEKISPKSPPSATITSSTAAAAATASSQPFVYPQSPSFKVPSGKEGSLKHRILTRPDDSTTARSTVDFQKPSTDGAVVVRKRLASIRSPPRSPSSKRPLNNSTMTTNFRRGQMIQLANGTYRKIEDMKTDDFIQSAKTSSNLKLCESTVVKIGEPRDGNVVITLSYNATGRSQVQMVSGVDHPYFVYGQGWASYNPEKTQQTYGLSVDKLRVGDVLISLIQRSAPETVTTAPQPPPSCATTRGTTIMTTATSTSMSTKQYTVNSSNTVFSPAAISNRPSIPTQPLSLPPPSGFPLPHPKSSAKNLSNNNINNSSSSTGNNSNSSSSNNSNSNGNNSSSTVGSTSEFVLPSTQALLLPHNYYHSQSPAETITSATAAAANNHHHHQQQQQQYHLPHSHPLPHHHSLPPPPPPQSAPLQLEVESKKRRWSAPDSGDDEKLSSQRSK